ncbi:ADP-heptose--LPS heptosyltransferase 2 [compost metagenome]
MLVGGPGDHPAAAPALAAAGERGIDCVGRGDILASAAAIARSALFVGNDSGLMHVAAATGTPTLGLFGPSEWWHKAPWGPKGRVLASSPVRGEFKPIEELTVEHVFEGVLALHDAYIGGANPDQP